MGNDGNGGENDRDNSSSSSDNNVASSISRTNDGFSGASAGFIKAGEVTVLLIMEHLVPNIIQADGEEEVEDI